MVRDHYTTNLITDDSELYSRMLEAYPGIIKGDQVSKIKNNDKKIYMISKLENNELEEFLRKEKY